MPEEQIEQATANPGETRKLSREDVRRRVAYDSCFQHGHEFKLYDDNCEEQYVICTRCHVVWSRP